MTRDQKAVLARYLQRGRDTLLWKLEGLGEYDIRRPMTPTGTNLLGLVKHLTGVEMGYLGDVFDRPFPDKPAWYARLDDEADVDLWATPDESRDDLVGLYRRVWQHADATIGDLDLDAVGVVPWWPPDRREPTLHAVLVHVVAEINRHAGHADILRETIDGAAGYAAASSNLTRTEADDWRAHRDRVEVAARAAARRPH